MEFEDNEVERILDVCRALYAANPEWIRDSVIEDAKDLTEEIKEAGYK